MIIIEILQNGVIQETFEVSEENNEDIYPIFFEEQQIGEVEIDAYYQDMGLEEPQLRFLVLSRKNYNYTIIRHNPFDMSSMSLYDTLRIDYQLDFEPYNQDVNCGKLG